MAQETQMLKGLLQGCVLAILSDDEMYGYKIIETLKSYGFEDIHEATVYPILTRLNKQGLLSYNKRPSELGPPRKYYSLTEQGIETLTSLTENWKQLNKSVQQLLKPKKS